MQRYVEVATGAGTLRGIEHREVVSFLGVPYGASTAAEGRFRPPQPVAAWEGVRDATVFGPSAPQVDSRLGAGGTWVDVMTLMYPRSGAPTEGGAISEDCLRLNVWTPSADDGGTRPVMVWLHGGGYVHGSGNEMLFHGDELARLGDVVVVTVTHRLGLLGFLPLDRADASYAHSGVVGMLDIVQALEWVRDEIHRFGGDPDNVTIFGQSGGGGKVNALTAMPAARGLFHKVINQSGASMALTPDETSQGILDTVLAAAGLTRATAAQLAELPIERVLEIQAGLGDLNGAFTLDGVPSGESGVWIAPASDAVHLPAAPFNPVTEETDRIPMLIGFTSHEATLMLCNRYEYAGFTEEQLLHRLRNTHGDRAEETLVELKARFPDEAPRLLLARLISDDTFRQGAIRLAEVKSAQSAPVYMYEFAYRLGVYDDLLGAPHSGELAFVFRTVDRSPFAGDRIERFAVSDAMAQAWAAFARTGDPNHDGIPHWARYGSDRTTMRIDTVWSAYTGPDASEVGIGDGLDF